MTLGSKCPERARGKPARSSVCGINRGFPGGGVPSFLSVEPFEEMMRVLVFLSVCDARERRQESPRCPGRVDMVAFTFSNSRVAYFLGAGSGGWIFWGGYFGPFSGTWGLRLYLK